jgi:hypothetical protein
MASASSFFVHLLGDRWTLALLSLLVDAGSVADCVRGAGPCRSSTPLIDDMLPFRAALPGTPTPIRNELVALLPED